MEAIISRITAPTRCIACGQHLEIGSGAWGVEGQEERLCLTCWNKVARGGRLPRQTIEAVLSMNDPEFGGPRDPCDHEDYRDLESLNLWPQ